MNKYMILGCRANGSNSERPMIMSCYWLKDDRALINAMRYLLDDEFQAEDLSKEVKKNGFAYCHHKGSTFKIVQTSDIEQL